MLPLRSHVLAAVCMGLKSCLIQVLQLHVQYKYSSA